MEIVLDNYIYNENKIIDKNDNIIFQGDFDGISKFVLDNFNETLPLDSRINEFKDFNGREFKIELDFHTSDNLIKYFVNIEKKENELTNIYNELFGSFSIKNILDLIETKKILDYKYKYDKFNFRDEDLIEEIRYKLFNKYSDKAIKVVFYPNLEIKPDSFMFTSELSFIEENKDIYIFETVQGQGSLHYIYNILENYDFPIETWKKIIKYSKELDILNKKYSDIDRKMETGDL